MLKGRPLGKWLVAVSLLSGTAWIMPSCADETPTPLDVDPQAVIRGYDPPAGCVPEVITTYTDTTETVLTTFEVPVTSCYPNLVAWGIDMVDPMGVDTPQGDGFFRINGLDGANLPSGTHMAFGGNYTPPQVMIEIDPPALSVAFHYSRLTPDGAYWGGWVYTDSMMAYAASRTPGTIYYTVYDSRTLYSNVPSNVPPFSVWTPVTFPPTRTLSAGCGSMALWRSTTWR